MQLEIDRSGVTVPVRPHRSGADGRPTPDQARGPFWRRSSLRSCGARRDGVAFTHDWLFDSDVEVVDGLPVTSVLRAVSFEARRARWDERAVQSIDMAAADDLADLASLAAYAELLVGRPGLRRLRRAIALADENAWSPMETTMRCLWVDAGHPRPRCNVPVFDRSGNHLITPDLFDADAGVAGEYDGAVHLDAGPRRRDLNRDALCRDLGIEVVTMMSTDLRDTADFRRRLAAAYRRAARRPRPDSWTTDQPRWWVDTSTVARRRALRIEQRARWLRRGAS